MIPKYNFSKILVVVEILALSDLMQPGYSSSVSSKCLCLLNRIFDIIWYGGIITNIYISLLNKKSS